MPTEICFVHVPKAAGTSVRADAARVLAPLTEIHSGRNLVCYTSAARPDVILTLIGHAARDGDYVTLASYKERHPNCFAVAFSRNPYDRLVSAFFYLASGGMTDEDRQDGQRYVVPYAGDFQRFVHEQFRAGQPLRIFEQVHMRPQVAWLCHRGRRLMVDYLGHAERVADDYRRLNALLGLDLGTPAHENRSAHGPWSDYYDRELRTLVYQAYRNDFEVLGYAG